MQANRITINEVLNTKIPNRLSNLINEMVVKHQITYLDEITPKMLGLLKKDRLKTKSDLIDLQIKYAEKSIKKCNPCLFISI